MADGLHKILKEFGKIRRKNKKLRKGEVTSIILFGIAWLTSVITGIISAVTNNHMVGYILLGAIVVLIILVFIMFAFVRNEKKVEYSQTDLEEINVLMVKQGISTVEARKVLRKIINNSMESPKYELIGMKATKVILITSVLSYVWKQILEGGFIISYKNGSLVVGEGVGIYIFVLIVASLVVAIANIIRIGKDKEITLKNDFLYVLDEVDLYLEIDSKMEK